MKLIRAILKDRSCAAAIMVILAQALILFGQIEAHASIAKLPPGSAQAIIELCSGDGVVTAEDEEPHNCCGELTCAVLCAQASGITPPLPLDGPETSFGKVGRQSNALGWTVATDTRILKRRSLSVAPRAPPIAQAHKIG
ncbi:hypothetical protein [Fulvimarina sp. MAC8]|uniref:hypothetical protein n=1 Tax=Fulvimarina sp. MAC8 TaxID=3162874 RepID=UPI0032ED5FE3